MVQKASWGRQVQYQWVWLVGGWVVTLDEALDAVLNSVDIANMLVCRARKNGISTNTLRAVSLSLECRFGDRRWISNIGSAAKNFWKC